MPVVTTLRSLRVTRLRFDVSTEESVSTVELRRDVAMFHGYRNRGNDDGNQPRFVSRQPEGRRSSDCGYGVLTICQAGSTTAKQPPPMVWVPSINQIAAAPELCRHKMSARPSPS